MSYKSTTGISGLVEKLKNVEAAIKATRERMERRASGLPPLPPPGLTPVYTSAKQKPQIDQPPSTTVTTSSQKPRGVTSVKPIIGLGRGKKFSKQNSFPSAFDDTSTITSDTGSVSSSDLKSSSSSSSIVVSQNELNHQPTSNSTGVHEHNLHLNQESTSQKFTSVSQPQSVASNTVSNSVLLNPIPVVANGGITINSTTANFATTSYAAPTADQIAKSFAKLSTKSPAVPFTSVPFTSQPSPSVTSQKSAPITSSRTMTYSSAVASYPARKPTPLFQPMVTPVQPVPRMPSMPPPLLATPMHPPMIGLGRGNVPWPGGPPPPPPHAYGGPWMPQIPPPAMPLHFDHHHNPFYEIPPLGSSSGLDII